jgi:hypothetical protein
VIIGTLLMLQVHSRSKGDGSSGFHAEPQARDGKCGAYTGEVSGPSEPKSASGAQSEDVSLYGSTNSSGVRSYT